MRIQHYLLALVGFSSCTLVGTQGSEITPGDRSVNLAGQRSPGIMLYQFSTDYLSYASDGSLVSKEQTVAEIEIEVDETGRQTLTAHHFELINQDRLRMSIPRLAGWQNSMDSDSDEVLGVPHADFAGLQTDTGEPLSPEIAHRVYNTFVDLYAFNNVFAQPSLAEGNRRPQGTLNIPNPQNGSSASNCRLSSSTSGRSVNRNPTDDNLASSEIPPDRARTARRMPCSTRCQSASGTPSESYFPVSPRAHR